MADEPNRDPLHGVTLQMMLEKLHGKYGWDGLAARIRIRCFDSDPSVKSSLVFLRRTPWARAKVERLYLQAFVPRKKRPGARPAAGKAAGALATAAPPTEPARTRPAEAAPDAPSIPSPIRTLRLVLAPIDRSYADDIFRFFTPAVTRYMYPKPPEALSETLAFIDGSVTTNTSGRSLQVVVLDGATHEFLGCAGLHGIDTPRPELGIWIKEAAHGHGYGLEAIAGLVDWARANLSFEYLSYPVDKRNAASRRIPERLGGIAVREMKELNKSGFELDEVEYRIQCSKSAGEPSGLAAGAST